MSVSSLAVVPVSPKLIVSQLQMSNSLKKSWIKPQALSNIFPVQFIYLQKLISTKVMKVNHGYDNSFYKVALTTLLHNSASLLWLQLQPNGWATLLGPKLNEKLKCAITSAIECHELLVAK